jgi:nicotinate-nucleotide adenylyltransferase
MVAQRIGVFGGTFDPPHIGHLVAAVNVKHSMRLDRLLLVVANVPWQKVGSRPLSDAEDRLAMVRSAVAGVPGLEASDLELRRGGESFTADTLAQLRAEDPHAELFVVVGVDAATGMPSWERVDEVRAAATVVVVDRPGVGPVRLPDDWAWERVEIPRLEVSSTDVRARVGDGRPLDYLLTPDVIDTIRARGLYRAG